MTGGVAFRPDHKFRPAGQFAPMAVAVVGTLVALVLGALIGMSAYLPLALVVGLLLGACVLALPRVAVWALVIGATSVVGLVELYLPQFQQVRWGFAVLSIALFAIAAVRRAGAPADLVSRTRAPGSGALGLLVGLLPVLVGLSALAGQLAPGEALVGLKNYFQMWGLIAALAWLGYSAADAGRFPRFLAALSLCQLPFALHQFLVLVPMRNTLEAALKNVVPVDVVAGTFGGALNGGGRSADLALLASMAVVYFLATWKWRRIGLGRASALAALAFAPIVLNEAKLAVVAIPVGLLILFRRNVIHRPLAMLLGTTVVVALMAGLVAVYSLLPGETPHSLGDFVDESIAYNVGDKGYGSARLNRSTVYSFWLRDHLRQGDLKGIALGHGPGSTNEYSGLARGSLAERRYAGFAIGLTGLSSLLWDVGLLGVACVLSLFTVAVRLAGRLAHEWRDTRHAPALETAQIGLVLVSVSLLHNNYFVFDIGFQALFAILLGYVFAMAQLRPEGAS